MGQPTTKAGILKEIERLNNGIANYQNQVAQLQSSIEFQKRWNPKTCKSNVAQYKASIASIKTKIAKNRSEIAALRAAYKRAKE